MSDRTKNRDTDLLHLCQEAKDSGASQAVVFPAAEIVVDERTSLKCQVPLCRHYGIDLMCPPNVMPVSQFKEILKCYDSAILIKVDIPSNDPPGNSEGKPGAEYLNVVREAKNKLREIVSRMEDLCFNQGYYFAAGVAENTAPHTAEIYRNNIETRTLYYPFESCLKFKHHPAACYHTFSKYTYHKTLP